MKNIEKSYFFISQGRFCLGGLDSIAKSKRVIEISFFDIANDMNLCSLLNLYYIMGNFGKRYTYQSRGEWFAGYISSFVRGDKYDAFYNHLCKNPMVRLLIEDEEIKSEYKKKTSLDLFAK